MRVLACSIGRAKRIITVQVTKMAADQTQPLHLSEEMLQYRNWLVAADQKSSEAYDKAVMTLSGGALGLSLTFIKDIVKSSHPILLWSLMSAWGCLTLSLAAILISMLSSQWALRKAIIQVDQASLPGATPGGGFAQATKTLNILAGSAFLAGITFLALFSISNYR